MSRLSFILPVYRPNLDILSKCVKSLKDQSLKDFEAIFVLDGKDDAARAVIKRGLPKAEIIEIEHGGACKARNEGAKHAKSDIWVFFDSDCVIEPDAAETWLMMFDRDPKTAFVYSGYRFLDEKGAIHAEPFDPWLLRVRNYVSTCFPLRKEYFPGWDESLESLQDWDFWLSVVEKGGKGKFLQGYAFATPAPSSESISGRGCADSVWLSRVDAVKKKHGLPERDACVSSLTKKHEGIWLAKLINADYQDYVTYKPHRYKTIIQLGFSFLPNAVEAHCSNFKDKGVKKVVFYTCEEVMEVVTRLNLNAIWKYSRLLNDVCIKQFVEDKPSYDIMKKAGFDVEIMPLPMAVGEPDPLPEKPKFGVDCAQGYGEVFDAVQAALPDVELVNMSGAHKLSDLTGLLNFHPDRTLGIGMKRAILGGRHVISNVQAPFMGYVDDTGLVDTFIPALVEDIRKAAYSKPDKEAREFYRTQVNPEAFTNAIA